MCNVAAMGVRSLEQHMETVLLRLFCSVYSLLIAADIAKRQRDTNHTSHTKYNERNRVRHLGHPGPLVLLTDRPDPS